MHTVFLVFHIIVALALITLVLLQQGKGADAGTGFGAGASSTVFGSRGSASFLSRVTAVLATGFFLTSMSLGYFATQVQGPTSVTERGGSVPVEQTTTDTPPSVPESSSSSAPAETSSSAPAAPQSAEDVPQVPSQQ